MKGGDTWELVLKSTNGNTVVEEIKDKMIQLNNASNVLVETTTAGYVCVNFFMPTGNDSNSSEQIFDWAVNNGLKILEMNRKKLSIEDIFVKLTREEKETGI
jgi:ABC-2 type transport system ATP-binding protein